MNSLSAAGRFNAKNDSDNVRANLICDGQGAPLEQPEAVFYRNPQKRGIKLTVPFRSQQTTGAPTKKKGETHEAQRLEDA